MDGILVIDKPEGLTSHDVVNAVRRITLTRKVGHAGTLDPFATGVLIVGVNQGTKLLPFLQEEEKEYKARVRLGVETDTLDRDGRVVRETPCPEITGDEMMRLLSSFEGRQSQLPPAYSAIKKDGVPLYKLARKGVAVEVPPREIEIYGISLDEFQPPAVSFTVRCSSGTYIRSLARDIGTKAGCGGHLESLRRTRSGGFSVDGAVPPARLKEAGRGWTRYATNLNDALMLQELQVSPVLAAAIRAGREFTSSDLDLKGPGWARFKVTDESRLVAVASVTEGDKVRFLRVFNP